MPGRRRTASRPSSTWMASAPYSAPLAPRRVAGSGRSTGSISDACAFIGRPSHAVIPREALVQPQQVVALVPVDDDPASLASRCQDDLRAEGLPQTGGHVLQVRVARAGRALPRRGRRTVLAWLLPDELLGLADGQAALLDEGEDALLVGMVGEAREGTGVPLRDAACAQRILERRGDGQQAQRVGRPRRGCGRRCWATCSWVSPNSSMRLPECPGLVERVEVRALEVLDQRERELLLLIGAADDGRDGGAAGEPRGTHPPLARDESETLGVSRSGALAGARRAWRCSARVPRAPPRGTCPVAGTG